MTTESSFEPEEPGTFDPDSGAATAVVAALPAETRSARPLARRGWRPVRTGVGGRRARAVVERLLATEVRRLLVWGAAGGLDPALGPGTVLVPTVVIGPDGGRHLPDPEWRAALLKALPRGMPLSEAPLVTVDTATDSVAAKALLRRTSGAAGVDMETAAVAAAAEAAGVPWAAIRVIADPARGVVPRAVAAAVGGRHFLFKFAWGLVLHPAELSDVVRLAREFRRACHTLGKLARTLAD